MVMSVAVQHIVILGSNLNYIGQGEGRQNVVCRGNFSIVMYRRAEADCRKQNFSLPNEQ